MAAVVDTDRTKVKKQQIGVAVPGGLTDPEGTARERDEETFSFDVGSDASIAEMGIRMKKKCRVKAVSFTPSTLLAAHATAYITQVIAKRDGAGGGAVTIATMDTATGGLNVSLAAFVPYVFALSTVSGAKVLAAGNVLTFKSTESSTPTTPIGKVEVTVEYI